MDPYRPLRQTNEEWIKEFATGKPVEPSTSDNKTHVALRYDSHRTTRKGRLILAFVDEFSGEEICAFFNVDIKIQRGAKKGQDYRPGHRGQFLPPPRSKFRKWWIEQLGEPPTRWARSYKELKPRAKPFLFTADISTGWTVGGEQFLKADKIKKVGTILEQKGNNSGTSWEQEKGTSKPLDANNDGAYSQTKVPNNENTLIPINPNTQIPNRVVCPSCRGEGCRWCEK